MLWRHRLPAGIITRYGRFLKGKFLFRSCGRGHVHKKDFAKSRRPSASQAFRSSTSALAALVSVSAASRCRVPSSRRAVRVHRDDVPGGLEPARRERDEPRLVVGGGGYEHFVRAELARR